MLGGSNACHICFSPDWAAPRFPAGRITASAEDNRRGFYLCDRPSVVHPRPLRSCRLGLHLDLLLRLTHCGLVLLQRPPLGSLRHTFCDPEMVRTDISDLQISCHIFSQARAEVRMLTSTMIPHHAILIYFEREAMIGFRSEFQCHLALLLDEQYPE